MEALISWIIFIVLLTLYGLIGTFIGSAIKYIRNYDHKRSKYTSRKPLFPSKDTDSVAFTFGVFWLPFGFLGLLYHWMHVGWDREERQIMKELGREPSDTKRELRARLKSIQDNQRRELERSIAQLEAQRE